MASYLSKIFTVDNGFGLRLLEQDEKLQVFGLTSFLIQNISKTKIFRQIRKIKCGEKSFLTEYIDCSLKLQDVKSKIY